LQDVKIKVHYEEISYTPGEEMKISLYSLSLSDRTPVQVVELAKKYGCDGIEWWCRENGHVDRANLEKSAKEISSIMDGSELEVAGLSPYFDFSENKDILARLFEAAQILGARNIRCHSYAFTGEIPVQELMRRQRGWLEAVVIPEAQRAGVRIMIEQHHNQICCTPNACRELVDGLPEENIGVIFDPGNSLFEGYTRPEYAISVIGKYLSHVHVKSARPVAEKGAVPSGRRYPMEFGAIASGDLDYEKIVAVLKAKGFDGFLSLEALDGRPGEQKMEQDILFLRKLVDSAE